MPDSPVTKEIERSSGSGYLWVTIGIALVLAGIFFVVRPVGLSSIAIGVVLILAGAFVLAGLYMLQPNEAAILLLFGEYVGTTVPKGCAGPILFRKQKISLRAHNLNSERLKVNDKRGNPIEIAAAIVWRVRNTAQAVFDVEDYDLYVRVQTETAIRHLASSYAYDEGEHEDSNEPTLRAAAGHRGADSELQTARTRGIVSRTRISRICFAPRRAGEVATAQAEGHHRRAQQDLLVAVSMVEMRSTDYLARHCRSRFRSRAPWCRSVVVVVRRKRAQRS